MEQIESLKKELSTIEGRPVVETSVEPDSEKIIRGLKGMFDHLLQGDYQKQDENTVSKSCPECYLTQAIENDSCTLCGATPKSWLLAEEEVPNGAGRAAYDERNMFRRMAAKLTVDELKTALRSGWASTPTREQYAKRLLELRQAQAIRVEQPKATEDQPGLNVNDLVTRGTRYYDQELEKISKELEAFKAQPADTSIV